MPTIPKSRSTSKEFNPFSPEMVRPVGQRPKPDRIKGGKRLLRDWQCKAFRVLQGQQLGMLIAPTGSGKSVAQKALVYGLLRGGKKVIIAVPETTIGDSFKSDSALYLLPNKVEMSWQVDPDNYLFGSSFSESRVIDRIIDFVRSSTKSTKAKRVLVCTHQALVRAHQRMMSKASKRSPWKGTTLVIDEAHRTRFLEEELTNTQRLEEEERCNRMGQLVEHYIQNRPGGLLLATATWLRGDQATIVPDQYLGRFTKYELPIDQYLEGLEHLKEIVFKVTTQPYPEVMKGLPSDPKKTIVYLPPVSIGRARHKYTLLSTLRNKLGRSIPSPNGFTRDHRSGLRSLDLVTEAKRNGADGRMTLWLQNKNATDVIFVQNLFRMGTDWPAAEQSIVLGFRASLPLVIQMLGRLLRDHPGKRRVEFHMVLPKTLITTKEGFWRYANAIFMLMALGWQFSLRASESSICTSRILPHLQTSFFKTVLSGENEGKSVNKSVEGMLKAAAKAAGVSSTKVSRFEVQSFKKSWTQAMGVIFNDLLNQLKAHDALHEDPFKVTREALALRVGSKRFKEIRELILGLPEVTVTYMDQLLFLERCLYFAQRGRYTDPRTIRGAVKLFGSKKNLDEACTREGMHYSGYTPVKHSSQLGLGGQ